MNNLVYQWTTVDQGLLVEVIYFGVYLNYFFPRHVLQDETKFWSPLEIKLIEYKP